MKTEQFVIKLDDSNQGQRGNFFAYGAFEKIIESGARLVDHIKPSSNVSVLLFERQVPGPVDIFWEKIRKMFGV